MSPIMYVPLHEVLLCASDLIPLEHESSLMETKGRGGSVQTNMVGHVYIALKVFPPHGLELLDERQLYLGVLVGQIGHLLVQREVLGRWHVNPWLEQWTNPHEQAAEMSKTHQVISLELSQDNAGVTSLLLGESYDPGP